MSDANTRDIFADFFFDGVTGPAIFALAVVCDYARPSVFLLGHIVSVICLFFFVVTRQNGNDHRDGWGRRLLFLGCALVSAALLQMDANFIVQIVCALDPDACCGELVPRTPTLRPVCSASVPEISTLAAVPLFVATAVLIIADAARWTRIAAEYPPAIVTLPLAIKAWQLANVPEWENIASFSTIFIGIASILQLLFAVSALVASIVGTDAAAGAGSVLKVTERSGAYSGFCLKDFARICCAGGVVCSYASVSVQSLMLEPSGRSALFGKETVAPIANLAFSIVALLAFLASLYAKGEDAGKAGTGGGSNDSMSMAMWFENLNVNYAAKAAMPVLLLVSLSFFVLALVFMDASPLFNATMLTLIFYTVTLVSQVRTAVYFSDDGCVNAASLVSYFLSDATFLGLVVTRWEKLLDEANLCLAAALAVSMLHSVLVGIGILSYSYEDSENEEQDQEVSTKSTSPALMWTSAPRSSKRAGSFKLL